MRSCVDMSHRVRHPAVLCRSRCLRRDGRSSSITRIAARAGAFVHPEQVPTTNGDDLPSLDRLTYLVSADLQSDDVPLWEIVWTLNALAPDAPLDEKVRLARSVVGALTGQYDLWRGEWPTGPVALLTEAEKRTLAHDDASWHDPEHASLLVWIREEGSDAPAQAG